MWKEKLLKYETVAEPPLVLVFIWNAMQIFYSQRDKSEIEIKLLIAK